MAAFVYRAVDPTGRSRSGVVEAGSDAGARQILREMQLLPVSVEATAAAVGTPGTRARPGLLERLRPAVGTRMLALVTRQLATLVDSGIRVEHALRTVASQCRRPRVASTLLNVRAGIMEGRSFAQSLGDYPRVFSHFYRASVAAGEESNQLGAVLLHLADYVETQQRNRQSVQLALIYPTLLAGVSLLIILMLLTYVVPDIARVFTARGEALPFLTRAMIGLGAAVASYGWMAGAGLTLAVLGFRRWLSAGANRRTLHRWLAEGRLTAPFSRSANAARFAGTLATLLQSGVALPDALDAAAEVASNLHIRAKIETVAERVRGGASLQRAVGEADCFPPMLVAMIASGESSARLGPALARAAADQQRDLDAWVATLVSLVEPGVLLLMGGIVLLMVLSILLPIVGLNELAGSGL